ncbi:POT family MFS transporter [Peredibacter sp. HCB2-198]|uniref:POT family MFS transporter n=1 Tax=Peredibacter sp. HCB2-198 TaxID=3383025 RepID=UPI0038B561CC
MSQAAAAASVEAVDNKFPSQIKYIVGNEACERYSYYGMRSILTVFMIQVLLMQEAEATSTYHLFAGACYLFPLLGAFISDRIWGKYKTILYLSLVYCAGHAVLAVWENKMGLYWGLGLIALGSGGIKPCVSAHVGDQFKANQQHLLKKVYELFYFMINFGSFFSTILTPWTLKAYGPSVAFGIPGVLMAIATVIFWMGRNEFVHVPPTKSDGHGLFNVVSSAFKYSSARKAGESFLDGALKDHSREQVDAVKAVFDIAKLFASITIFWALFDQHGSSWVIQAMNMNLNFMGMEFEASQIAAWNPIMVMGLIPFFSMVVYPMLDKMGITSTPIKRMTLGMFVAAVSFALIGGLQMWMDNSSDKINVMWQFFPYLVITMAEVMISITGLEFAYTQAPRSMKSSIMSIWLLTVFFGNLITAYVSKVNFFPIASTGYFMFFAVLMAIFAGIFWYMGTQYKVKNYMEK